MSVDDPDKKPLNQTRFGVVTGHANERQMLDSRSDSFGIRTIIKNNGDGTETVCRTHAGMPRFTTDEQEVASEETKPLRGFVATINAGGGYLSYLLKFNDQTKTVSKDRQITTPPTVYSVTFETPVDKPYADTAYAAGAYYVNGKKITTGDVPVFVFDRPSAYQRLRVFGWLDNAKALHTGVALQRGFGYGTFSSAPYAVALTNPNSIEFLANGTLRFLWSSDVYDMGSVTYSVTPEATTLVSEVKIPAPTLIPISLSSLLNSTSMTPPDNWDIPEIQTNYFLDSVNASAPGLNCFWGSFTIVPSTVAGNFHKFVRQDSSGSKDTWVVTANKGVVGNYGAASLTKTASVYGDNSYGSATQRLHIVSANPDADAFITNTLAAGDGWSWQPSASYPGGYLATGDWDGGNEYRWELNTNTSLVITADNLVTPVYQCVYTLHNLTSRQKYMRSTAEDTGSWPSNGVGCNGENGYYKQHWGMSGAMRWGNFTLENKEEIVRTGPNIDGSWEVPMYKDAENGVSVVLRGEIVVRCTNRGINRVLIADTIYENSNVEYISASITMDMVVSHPGGTIVDNLMTKHSVGAGGAFNAVMFNYIPNPDAAPGNQIYVPVCCPEFDIVGQVYPPAEQGNTMWIAYETAAEFADRTEVGKQFRFLMSYKGALPVPNVVIKMFLPYTDMYPKFTHPFYEFVDHQTPTGEVESPNKIYQYAYNQKVNWLPSVFPDVSVDGTADLTRI